MHPPDEKGAAPHALFETLTWVVAHPEDAAKPQDIDFPRQLVHEALRLHPPVPALLRAPLEDVLLASGRLIRGGKFIALDPDAVNRSYARFPVLLSERTRSLV